MTQTLDLSYTATDGELNAALWQETSLQVRDLMSRSPVTITPEMSVQAAHALMQRCRIRHLPVVVDSRLVGMVSDRDLRSVLPSPAISLARHELTYLLDRLTVRDMMSRFVITVTPDASVAAASRRMIGQKIGALPVVANGQLIGILTRSDVLRAFIKLDTAKLVGIETGA